MEQHQAIMMFVKVTPEVIKDPNTLMAYSHELGNALGYKPTGNLWSARYKVCQALALVSSVISAKYHKTDEEYNRMMNTAIMYLTDVYNKMLEVEI